MTTNINFPASWSLGGAVWLCAVLVFPLHLGWAGAPIAAFGIYAGAAAGLLLTADILHNPADYRARGSVRAQASPFLLAVAAPATIAFAIGHTLAPIEDAMEEDVCRIGGLSTASDGPLEGLDDSFDLTADCELESGAQSPTGSVRF